MSACITHSEVREIGESFLDEFDRRFPTLSRDLCAPFYQEARQLEAHLTSTYKWVAMLARAEEDLGAVSALWGIMVHLCDEATKRLGRLSGEHPNCGSEQYLDRIADIRNKCRRLQTMHS